MTLRFALFLCFILVFNATGQDSESDGPKKWEASIADFEARDEQSPPPDGALLFVGSSSIRLWDLDSSWPERDTINNGFGGSTLADSIHFFDRLFPRYRPSAIVVYAGDNDVNNGLGAKEVARDFETLASSISAVFPETPIIYIAIKPSTARWSLWPKMKQANELVSSLCNRMKHWVFADIAKPMLKDADGPPGANWFVEDGLHLSEFGYREWTKVVNSALRRAGVQ